MRGTVDKLIKASVLKLGALPIIKDDEEKINPEKLTVLLLKLGYIADKTTINELSRAKNIKEILNALTELKGVNLNWQNTLFTIDEVINTPEEELRVKTLIHYFTTYGVEFLQRLGMNITMETYFPSFVDFHSLT